MLKLTKTPEIVVFTDVGEECDDQVALFHLLTTKIMKQNICVVFTGSADKLTQDESMNLWKNKFAIVFTATQTVTYMTFDKFALTKHRCDFALQISPIPDYGTKWTGKNLTVRERYILAGDAEKSFNSAGSSEVIKTFKDKLILIPSKQMALMRPNVAVLNGLPKTFIDECYFCGFKLLFGRMNPYLLVSKTFAQGLVNPHVGRGANWTTVSAVFESMFGKKMELRPLEECGETNVLLAKRYFKDIGPEVLHDDSVRYLANINRVLDLVVPGIWCNRKEVYYSSEWKDSTFGGSAFLHGAFATYVENVKAETLAPFYDLFAVMVLMGAIEEKDYRQCTREEFLGFVTLM